ncbi:MAG: cation transporter [Chlorobaculum sp.]|nr:cation transporter [Chlorobaculum sp.]
MSDHHHDHNHSHDHHHDHGHAGHHHHHAVGSIKTAFFMNAGFTILEAVGGVMTNSTAILANAVHDFGDSFALGQAWYFEKLSARTGDGRYSYGYQRFSIFGALVSAIMMLASSFLVLVQAVPRLLHPEHPNAKGMVAFALAGVAVNALAMLRLKGQKGMNARVIALHLLEDVLGWLSVLLVSVVLLFVSVPMLDPLLAILITLYILTGVVKNLRSLVPVFLQAVPHDISLDKVVSEIQATPHVSGVHHAHLWSLDGERTVFTAHLEIDCDLDPAEHSNIKEEIRALVARHGIYHSTVELEYPGEVCRNEPPKGG